MFTISFNKDFNGVYNASNPNGESYTETRTDRDMAFDLAELLDCDGAFKIEVRDADHNLIYSIPNVRN